MKGIFNMKKIFFAVVMTIMLFCILPMDVNAETMSLKTPSVQYKLINHDEVKLRWNKVDSADKYYIYRYDFDKMKYIKAGEVRTTQCRITGLEPTTKYKYAVVAVKIDGEEEIHSNVRSTEFTTPEEWYYYIDSSETNRDIMYNSTDQYMYRKHFDGTGEEKFDVTFIYNEVADYYSNLFEIYEVPTKYGEGIAAFEDSATELRFIEQHNGVIYFSSCNDLYNMDWDFIDEKLDRWLWKYDVSDNSIQFLNCYGEYRILFDKIGNEYSVVTRIENEGTDEYYFVISLITSSNQSDHKVFTIEGNNSLICYASGDSGLYIADPHSADILYVNYNADSYEIFMHDSSNSDSIRYPLYCTNNSLYYLYFIKNKNRDDYRVSIYTAELADSKNTKKIYDFGNHPVNYFGNIENCLYENGYFYFNL